MLHLLAPAALAAPALPLAGDLPVTDVEASAYDHQVALLRGEGPDAFVQIWSPPREDRAPGDLITCDRLAGVTDGAWGPAGYAVAASTWRLSAPPDAPESAPAPDTWLLVGRDLHPFDWIRGIDPVGPITAVDAHPSGNGAAWIDAGRVWIGAMGTSPGRVIGADTGPATHVAWSPDGQALAWAVTAPDGRAAIYRISAVDAPPERVADVATPIADLAYTATGPP